ncbi:hypothetical protein LCGC14_2195490 [marine sediment metagenome]|uniref:Anhydro-N-acetylmuramic acid kinase n=1 Tax=marine sediment metagenome TaxID=412755 RepID=A0A0F9DIF2_9ZZZZ|nr:anhydro-N-acetylmuramic acid kinase [Bacteroides sp.]
MIILGIMSGTSLDGLDLAICSFEEKTGIWAYHILHTETVPYDENWIRKLDSAPYLSGLDLQLLDLEYGKFISEQANAAVVSSGIEIELIASHGHTVFHQPEGGYTLQIGNPQVIAAVTGVQTVGNFRQLDMLYGGQGAPLVPVGDDLLFGEYEYCLNLGGFANISYKHRAKRFARDICPANIVLNRYARDLDLPFDNEGKAGRSGNICQPLYDRLNTLPYFSMEGPGSLAREWLESEFLPLIGEFMLPVTDTLRTLSEHIAFQVSRQIKPHSKILVTGGGAYNIFLLERISHHSQSEISSSSVELIEFKEAMVFAFLGLLKIRGEINCYSSVTGAEKDSCCGVLYTP